MKTFILAVLFVLLTGCSLIQSSYFDNFEYNGFIEIMTSAEIAHEACGVANIHYMRGISSGIANAAHRLDNYTLHRINNENTVEITKTIRATAEEFEARYLGESVSVIYCEAKTSNIIDQAKLGADAVQKKVRR